MDSVTQAALGAAIGGAIAPAGLRRKALLAGAALGTLPDLDVLIDYGDAVANFTYHRGFSHSLFVLPPFAVLLWLALRRWWAPVREAPWRWLAIIGLALITHPLLDAHTAYGTQLLWPLTVPPTMWATLFIIDPHRRRLAGKTLERTRDSFVRAPEHALPGMVLDRAVDRCPPC
ncbi:MAG: metal-dependent hydrolase [Woeseiaceae bacterium]